MQFVNEEDDFAIALFYFVEHCFQPLLKFAAVFRACDQSAHIEGEDRLILQAVRYVAAHNSLGKPFCDRRFAHAWLADEHGVVLCFTGEDADDVANFFIPANDRVKLFAARALDKVVAVFFQRVIGIFRRVGRYTCGAAHPHQNFQKGVLCDMIVFEKLLQFIVGVVEQGEKEVLNRDEFILHIGGNFFSRVQRLIHILRHINFVSLPARARYLGDVGELEGEIRQHGLRIHLHLDEQLMDEPLLLG